VLIELLSEGRLSRFSPAKRILQTAQSGLKGRRVTEPPVPVVSPL